MLRQIQALDFLLLGDSQADGPIHDLEDHQRSHHAQHPRDSDSHELVEHLPRVAIDQPDRRCRPLRVLKDGIDGLDRKDAGQERTQRCHPRRGHQKRPGNHHNRICF